MHLVLVLVQGVTIIGLGITGSFLASRSHFDRAANIFLENYVLFCCGVGNMRQGGCLGSSGSIWIIIITVWVLRN